MLMVIVPVVYDVQKLWNVQGTLVLSLSAHAEFVALRFRAVVGSISAHDTFFS